MNTIQNEVDIVELGVASDETQGGHVASIELGGLQPHATGISDDD